MSLVVVTGGSSGIGGAICTLFLSKKWSAISLSRRKPKFPGVMHFPVDLSSGSISECMAVFSRIEKQRICLVHNAGVFIHDRATTPNHKMLERMLRLSVMSPAKLNQAILPMMEHGSSIIYIGSTLSGLGVPDAFSYITAKHAIVGMMRATQQDCGPLQIHACCICPGFADTEMVVRNKLAITELVAERVSLGRLVNPEEIASLVHFCALNPVVNGAVLHANLGQVNS